jgi:hypothetical protein
MPYVGLIDLADRTCVRALRIVLLIALASGWIRAQESATVTDADTGDAATRLAALRARDTRLGFGQEAARRAFVALEGSDDPERVPLDEAARAAALTALGAAGVGFERLKAGLAEGSEPEREARLFALAEFSSAGWDVLSKARAEESVLAGADSWWLARGGDREVVAQLAAEPYENSAAARLALCDPLPDAVIEALARHYERRWRAAFEFGFIDGVRGESVLAAELFASPDFRERVIWTLAGELDAEPVKMHLVEALRRSCTDGVLLATLRILPEELVRARAGGLFEPDDDAWQRLLACIDEEHLERATLGLLKEAMSAGGARASWAGRLLLRGGADLPWKWVGEELEHGTPAARRALIAACGERGDKARMPDLLEILENRADLGVYGASLVTLARLGNAAAKGTLDTLVKGPPSPQRDEVLEALAAALHDRTLQHFGEAALAREDLAAEPRLALALGFARAGALLGREVVRTSVRRTRDAAVLLRCARALARSAQPADIEALAARFPFGTEPQEAFELNLELATVLLRAHHPRLTPCLRSALWGADWNQSILAGGLFLDSGGTAALLDELTSAPVSTGERELRRAGFALGEFGGLGAVEELTRARGEGDPVLQGALFGALSRKAEARPRPTTTRPGLPAEKGAPAKAGAGRKRRPGR